MSELLVGEQTLQLIPPFVAAQLQSYVARETAVFTLQRKEVTQFDFEKDPLLSTDTWCSYWVRGARFWIEQNPTRIAINPIESGAIDLSWRHVDMWVITWDTRDNDTVDVLTVTAYHLIPEAEAPTEQPPLIDSLTALSTTFVITDDGLVLWRRDLDPQEDELEPTNDEQYLKPSDVLLLGELINRNSEALETAQTRLDEVYFPLAEAILAHAGDLPKMLAASFTEWSNVRYKLYPVYISLIQAKEHSLFQAWYKQSFRTRYSHDQQAELLFQYVKVLYYSRYPMPARQVDEEEEFDDQEEQQFPREEE